VSDDEVRTAAEIFADALELPTEERTTFLDRACAGRPELREEVETLLAVAPKASGILRGALDGAFERIAGADPNLGRTIGPWRIVALIATGGMGAVYRAERTDTSFEMQAAIKLIRPGLRTEALLNRFRTERQLLADLDHPGIARLLDGGTTTVALTRSAARGRRSGWRPARRRPARSPPDAGQGMRTSRTVTC
jgi:hypothetical protein